MNNLIWMVFLIFHVKSIFAALIDLPPLPPITVPLSLDFFPISPKFNESNVVSLDRYGADETTISMVGISSGAVFATYFHIAHSSRLVGVGLIAGPPWGCSQCLGSAVGLAKCMQPPILNAGFDAINEINKLAALEYIDDPTHLNGQRVYVLNGNIDLLVNPKSRDIIEQYYTYFNCTVKNVKNINAAHGMITKDYGWPCFLDLPPWMLDCGYNAAYESLNHIYGNIASGENTTADGHYITFDQSEFTDGPPENIGMDKLGFAYIPKYCKNNPGCRLVVAHHGCLMGREVNGLHYVQNSGYNEIAERNNIIIIYPQSRQVIKPLGETDLLFNWAGCHDWQGYNAKNCTHRDAPHFKAMNRIIDRVISYIAG